MNRFRGRNRRLCLRALAALPLVWRGGSVGLARAQHGSHPSSAPLRVGLTPAFLHDSHTVVERWRDYLIRHLARPVEFVLRDSYRETMDLFRLGQLDFAWICDYPYLQLRRQVRLLAVPLFRGRPEYRSYLIVNAADSATHSIADLRGKLFAFADPLSNTGYLVPRYQLHLIGETPERFFAKHFFTFGHRKIVEAVASGLADAGAVDSFVWETLAELSPTLTGRTRVAWRSAPFGFPPLVAHRERVGEEPFGAMQRALLSMRDDPEGRDLLADLNIDGFIAGAPELYDGVAKMMRALGEPPD